MLLRCHGAIGALPFSMRLCITGVIIRTIQKIMMNMVGIKSKNKPPCSHNVISVCERKIEKTAPKLIIILITLEMNISLIKKDL
jgi:hypothetical protein